MGIHTHRGDFCPGCNTQFLFILYHMPHCTNPLNSPVLKRLQRESSTGSQGQRH